MAKCVMCAHNGTDECKQCILRTRLIKHDCKFEHKACSNCYWFPISEECKQCSRNPSLKITDRWSRK